MAGDPSPALVVIWRPVLTLAAALVSLAPVTASADEPPAGLVVARRTTRPPVIDGRVDEAAWDDAIPFRAFVDFFPVEGARPSEATELRVLHDDVNVYFGFICHDSQPDSVERALGDRDAPPVSDSVEVAIDVAHDRRTAYLFGVNAGGVQYDRTLYADNQAAPEWDAVWEAQVAARSDGWSAEIVVPLRLFRLGHGQLHRWGFLARRHLARTHEDLASVPLPRSSRGYVSLFGELGGLVDLRPRRNLELLPYLASRVVVHPQLSQRAQPRLTDPSLDLGLDLRAVISRLQLNATINPDFGQVESDQIILNLTNQEAVFPEKRPFFFQGTEIFQPVGAAAGVDGGQVLFYSRRIGLTTPILGAAKLTGELGPRLTLGLLDAFVTGVPGPVDEGRPDRRVRLHPGRPFHLGPNSEAVTVPAVPENYFAGVLTYKVGAASSVGLRAASAIPLAGPCPERLDSAGQPLPPSADCAVVGDNAGAVDWQLRTPDAAWAIQGQAEVAQVVGGPATRVLQDGSLLRRGQLGSGTYLQAGKLGGEPFRFDVDFARISPALDLNGAGFMPSQNQQDLVAQVHYIRPGGWARLHSFDSFVSGRQTLSTDGRNVQRGRNVTFTATAVIPGFHTVGLDTGYEFSYFDIREIAGTGIPFQRLPVYYVSVNGRSDPTRTFSVSGSLARDWILSSPVTPGHVAHTLQLDLVLRLQRRLESRLDLAVSHEPFGPRWTGVTEGDRLIFGDLQSGYLSLTFRQQAVLLPRLVLQAYAQLFTAAGHYASYFQATAALRRPIALRDLDPTDARPDGFYRAGLRVNLVLRWEYRLGSTLFVVYNHATESLTTPGQPVPASLSPSGLGGGRAVDTFLMKWSYFWHL
jgi:hypothetical protein